MCVARHEQHETDLFATEAGPKNVRNTEKAAATMSLPDKEFETLESWRAELAVGSAVDLKDTTGSWFQAQVMQIEEGQKISSDVKKDDVSNAEMTTSPEGLKLHYVGWADNLDEWLPRVSPIMQG